MDAVTLHAQVYRDLYSRSTIHQPDEDIVETVKVVFGHRSLNIMIYPYGICHYISINMEIALPSTWTMWLSASQMWIESTLNYQEQNSEHKILIF